EFVRFPKPDWSPERFRASMYTCHLSALRRDVIDEVGGFRNGFDGSQDHDLILRATERIAANGRTIVHLPAILYHWRHITTSVSREGSTLTVAVANGLRAVQEQCDRMGIDAKVEHGPLEGTYRLVRGLPSSTAVTVVVPVRADADTARAAITTMESLDTSHPTTRLVVAYSVGLPVATVSSLDDAAGDRWQLVPVAGEWSIAAALDRAFNEYPCDVLISVAPGLVPRSDVTPDWLETLAGLARSPGTGIAGALVADDGDAIVHAGWDVPAFREFQLEGVHVGAPSTGNDLLIERETGAVTLAAAAMSAAHWREFRGRAHGDFDAAGRSVSAALATSGLRNMWTPYARFDRIVAIRPAPTGSRYRPSRVARGLVRRARAARGSLAG
ncbi:MAG TPA: hypothetical protein VGC84_01640, partial [Ilumatobacteraceae bacterium]